MVKLVEPPPHAVALPASRIAARRLLSLRRILSEASMAIFSVQSPCAQLFSILSKTPTKLRLADCETGPRFQCQEY